MATRKQAENAQQPVKLDLNNPVFQRNLFSLQQAELLAAIKTLRKISGLTWQQVYADHGLKWEKIGSVAPPPGIDAVYSLRITQGRRATACRDAGYMRLLSIPPDHDATYKH